MIAQKFDPFAAAREEPEGKDSAGNFLPGLLMARQMQDAHGLLKNALELINSGQDATGHHQLIADTALDLMNAWAALYSASGGQIIAGNAELQERERLHITASFLAGYRAACLVDLTATSDADRKEATEEARRMIRVESAHHAAGVRTAPVKQRRAAIKEIWASGKFTARDTCADEEWEALGFPSRRAAREALTGTPEPIRERAFVPTKTRQRGVSSTNRLN